MGARPWLPMTMIAWDTGAACGGQWQHRGATQQNICAFTSPSSSLFHPLSWNLLLVFHPSRLKWGELPRFTDDCSVRYVMKDWRPGCKLESDQSVQVSDWSILPGWMGHCWGVNGSLCRGNKPHCLMVGHSQRGGRLFWSTTKPKGQRRDANLAVLSFQYCMEQFNRPITFS